MTVSAFSVVKNEAQFIGYGLMSILPYVDEVVYFDGNSTDGTLLLLDHIKATYDKDNKIKVFRDRDFKDFKDDYVRVFNECMKECRGQYLWYNHPDMILTDPGRLVDRENLFDFAYFVHMRSFAGEDLDLEITKGRTNRWKPIMRNRFGLKYWGSYGDPNEDMYFQAVTGNSHRVFKDMTQYPYHVGDSGIQISHFCECKPRARREEKMGNVIRTVTAMDESAVNNIMANHPRVTLQSGDTVFGNFQFVARPDTLPAVFEKHREEFDQILGRNREDIRSVAGAR